MKKTGLLLGLAIGIILSIIPIAGLTQEARLVLGLTVATLIFWTLQVTNSAFIAALYLALLIIIPKINPSIVFSAWKSPIIMMMLGAFIIGSALKKSGLGQRLGLFVVYKFCNNYKNTIIAIFILNVVLSLVIPIPWPRAFLIMSIVTTIIESSKISKEDSRKLGFAVFASSVPSSLVFLTGDSSINPYTLQTAGINLGFFDWFYIVGIPSLIMLVIQCLVFLLVFRQREELSVDISDAKEKYNLLGPLTLKEKKTIFWMLIAVIVWFTDSIHGIHIAWTTIIIAIMMSLPIVGEIVDDETWKEIPFNVFIFITAAIAIGNVSGEVGLTDWIVQNLIPKSLPQNTFVLISLIAVISMVLHMILGSVITVISIVIPIFIAITSGLSISPILVMFTCFVSIAAHYILPFQHLNIMVGLGENNGGYDSKEVVKFGIVNTFVVLLSIVLVYLPYWKLIGEF